MTKKLTFYWHIHHKELVEPLTEPIENRIAYIKKDKSKKEQPLRLKLLKKVKGKLPKEFIEASRAWVEADKAWVEVNKAQVEAYKVWDETYKAWVEADKAWVEAYEKYYPDLKKLHDKECECAWNKEDGIFSEKKL